MPLRSMVVFEEKKKTEEEGKMKGPEEAVQTTE